MESHKNIFVKILSIHLSVNIYHWYLLSATPTEGLKTRRKWMKSHLLISDNVFEGLNL